MPPETVPGLDTVECPACYGRGRVPLHPVSQKIADLTQVIPLSGHATSAMLKLSTSPTESVRLISTPYVKEPDGTAWRVLSMTVDGVRCDDPPYPVCRGNCWIDLVVECPHDHPPTEARPTKLHGAILCEASDLPVSAGDTERDRQWTTDFRGLPPMRAAVDAPRNV